MSNRLNIIERDMVIYNEELCIVVEEDNRVLLVNKNGCILLTCESLEELNNRGDVTKFVGK